MDLPCAKGKFLKFLNRGTLPRVDSRYASWAPPRRLPPPGRHRKSLRQAMRTPRRPAAFCRAYFDHPAAGALLLKDQDPTPWADGRYSTANSRSQKNPWVENVVASRTSNPGSRTHPRIPSPWEIRPSRMRIGLGRTAISLDSYMYHFVHSTYSTCPMFRYHYIMSHMVRYDQGHRR